MKNNIENNHNCYGCGVCSIACKAKIIDIRLNQNGFYEPFITDPGKCIHCGICIDVCSFSNSGIATQNTIKASYGAWSKDDNIRHICSSGGVGYEVGKNILFKGGKVCGVRYNVLKKRAEHFVASNIKELEETTGSKYIQSYTVEGLTNIVNLIEAEKREKHQYLVTGTPCQIDSFRRFIQRFKIEENFILLDFFCHGVPSKLLWDKYIKQIEKEIGEISHVSWRDKQSGWHESYSMNIIAKQKYSKRFSQKDPFLRLFLGDCCLGKACYNNCKFKLNKSSADIRIGDAWGTFYKKNEQGISAVITFTTKGDILLQESNCYLEQQDFKIISEGQMKTPASISKYSPILMSSLKKSFFNLSTIYDIRQLYLKMERRIKNIKNNIHA